MITSSSYSLRGDDAELNERGLGRANLGCVQDGRRYVCTQPTKPTTSLYVFLLVSLRCFIADEVRLLSRCRHPNVTMLLGFAKDDMAGRRALVYENPKTCAQTPGFSISPGERSDGDRDEAGARTSKAGAAGWGREEVCGLAPGVRAAPGRERLLEAARRGRALRLGPAPPHGPRGGARPRAPPPAPARGPQGTAETGGFTARGLRVARRSACFALP